MNLKREQRTEAILSSLDRLDYLSRSQIQRLHDLGSDRNTYRVISGLKEYVSSFRDGENIFYLNKAGRDRIDSQKPLRKKSTQARHFIMRNALYIAYGCPNDWSNEMLFEVEGKFRIVSDATFKRNDLQHIVEVDHTQKMSENRKKIDKYQQLKRYLKFRLVWITTTEYRRKKLAEMCKGLDVQVYTANDFK